MSEFATEESWPAEADAVAGNVDFSDEYVDQLAGEFTDDDYQAPVPMVDTTSDEFQELARQYAVEHVDGTLQRVIDEQVAPLAAGLEAAMQQRSQTEGRQLGDTFLESYGVPADDRETVFELAEESLASHAAEEGLSEDEIASWLGNGDPRAGAEQLLKNAADALSHTRRMHSGDELALAARYTMKPQSPAAPVARDSHGTIRDEMSLIHDYAKAGRFK